MHELDIILTYFHTDILITKCVEQLLKTEGVDFRIWIADNTKVSVKKLRKYFHKTFSDPRINVIEGAGCNATSGMRRGRHHPAGYTVVLRQTKSPIVALFHADSWPLSSDWYFICKKQLDRDKVELVGIQHESSIHHSFHLFRRETLNKYKFEYTNKSSFKAFLIKYVENPFFMHRRHKWDFGELFAIKIYENGGYTVGLSPNKACFPINEDIPGKTWRMFRSKHGYGIIYGDLIFHLWRSFRFKNSVEEKKDFFLSNKYIDEFRVANNFDDNLFILNDGLHHNNIYVGKNNNEEVF